MIDSATNSILKSEWRVFTLFALAAITLFFFLFVDNFDPVGEPLLVAHNFTEWKTSDDNVTFEGDDMTVAILNKKKIGDRVFIVYTNLIKIGAGYLRLSARIKAENLKREQIWTGGGALFLIQKNDAGKSMLNLPNAVMWEGEDFDWKKVSAIFFIDDRTRSARVFANIYKATGVLKLKNIVLEKVERPTHLSITIWLLIALWIITVIATSAVLFKNLTLVRAITLGVAFIAIAGTLMPTKPLSKIKDQTEATVAEVNHANGEKVYSEPFPWGIAHKGGHLLAYITIAFLTLIGWREKSRLRVFGYLCGYALIMELLQLFIDGRSAHLSDGLINITGVLIGFIAFYCVTRFMRRVDTSTAV